jgi:hypothetical protein
VGAVRSGVTVPDRSKSFAAEAVRSLIGFWTERVLSIGIGAACRWWKV